MRKLFLLIGIAMALLAACQDEDVASRGERGYLRLEVSAVSTTNTKAVPENYDPTRLRVVIKDADGAVVKSTDDYAADWKDQPISLLAGDYTVTASSSGFDGNASGENLAYYVGSTTVTVPGNGASASASITCTLANVKVTFHFDPSVIGVFKNVNIDVKSSVSGIDAQYASLEASATAAADRVVYFPVGDLTVSTVVTGTDNVIHDALVKNITGVKERDHYILNCKLGDTGSGCVTVSADDTEKEYTYTIYVPTKSTTSLAASADIVAWSHFACLEGEILAAASPLDPTCMRFEYQEAGSGDDWKILTATADGELAFKATLTGLTPAKTYSYRLAYHKDEVSYTSEPVNFTTEAAPALYNGSLDLWASVAVGLSKKDCWYPNEVASASFWDTSNPGGAKYVGSNTTPEETMVHTEGGKSARLESKSALGILAAASLYAGEFAELVGTSGAKIDFGRPFTGRPTQLTGWFQYTSKAIGIVGDAQPANTVVKGDPDRWSAYVVLTNGTYQLNNTDMAGTSKDFASILRNGKDADGFDVIAYGALEDSFCARTVSAWTPFTIDLTYRDLVSKPTHIIVLFSSSKYGDYFTGGEGSTLYLDDLELVYGDSPKTLSNQ